MGEQMRKAWDKNAVVVCMVVAVLLAIAFGFSLASIANQSQVVELSEMHRKERANLKRWHRADVSLLRATLAESKLIIARQSDQIFELSKRGATCHIQSTQ